MKDSQLALYRKYRPNNFKEVLGQDHVIKVIEGSLKEGKISHAYLFYGPRGTGKTTIARIMANVLGCSVNDVYEMDAASNRGIDDVRNIKESVHTLPFDSKYKIYILDEVHMFTKDAWNALLKTIEEPPSHVIFILATTELEKIPETIISRCQSFTLKKPNDITVSSLLLEITQKEGFILEQGGANLISLLAEGSFRDALGILQKVLSFSKNQKIKVSQIEEITGSPNTTLVNDFLDVLVSKDLEKGFLTIQKVSQQNLDMIIYLKMILSKLRYCLMLRYAPATQGKIMENISEEDLNYLMNLISSKSEYLSSRTLSILLQTYQNSRNSIIVELPLELALIQILNIEK